MERITNAHLEHQVDTINELTKSPAEPWTSTGGRSKANVGNYHIDGAYGGVELSRMISDGGGTSAPLGSGHVTKRELYNRLRAFIAGIETGKNS